ncbi:MAG TPA: LLM class flavin-dependent oxidoreductase [Nitrososphaerales archaeon]|nr:LLM class flavin-dependent oxidoreductase [Nitrososphaerales archaeon]
MRFGIALETFTPPGKKPDATGIYETSTLAEVLGFGSLWVWDHILLGSRNVFPVLDSLTTLASVGAKTSKVNLGTSVLIVALRNPVVLAKVLSTIQYLTNGRLVIGAASGWYEREFKAVGVEFSKRGHIFESRFNLVRKLLLASDVNYSEDGFNLEHASMEPRHPKKIPMLMGGYSDTVLSRVGRISDGWVSYYYTPKAYSDSWKKIETSARKCGRDPSTLRRVNIVPLSIGRDFDEADARVRKFTSEYMDLPRGTDCSVESSIRGTISECIAQIRAYADSGVDELVFIPCNYDIEQVEKAGKEIIPEF